MSSPTLHAHSSLCLIPTVNYVLYNSKGLFILSNLDFALFSPRFHESYALVIVPQSDTTNIVDIKFKQVRAETV